MSIVMTCTVHWGFFLILSLSLVRVNVRTIIMVTNNKNKNKQQCSSCSVHCIKIHPRCSLAEEVREIKTHASLIEYVCAILVID